MDAFSAGGDSDDGDGSWTADDPLTCSPSGTACDELFDILGASSDCVDDGDDVAEHGYEREPQQRRAEIRRVRELLSGGAVSPHIRRHGASLVYHALIYDHRHPPEMLRVVVEAGADVNAPILLTSSSDAERDDERPLDCELWLELEGPYAAVNAQKRDYLIAHGATRSAHGLAVEAEQAARAADAAVARAAELAARDAALERRLDESRREWMASRVPSWD